VDEHGLIFWWADWLAGFGSESQQFKYELMENEPNTELNKRTQYYIKNEMNSF